MADRIDALAGLDRRLPGPLGELLSADLDEALQALVKRAASELQMPIALVSLVLDNIQFFRAHHGLPEDLAAVRASSRDTSFCQFVVRDDDLLEVTDAQGDARLPQALVDRYGIRAYLGAPVRLGDQPLGSLCVLDTRPRTFSDADRAQLRALATKVNAQLARLSGRATSQPMAVIRAAIGPAFAELRNALMPLGFVADETRTASFEFEVFATAVEMGADHPFLMHNLTSVKAATARLRESADMLDATVAGVVQSVEAIEALADTGATEPTLASVLEQAGRLALHVTRTVGGINWQAPSGDDRLALPGPIAAAALASVINWMVELMPRAGTLAGRACVDGAECRVDLTCTGFTRSQGADVARRLALSGLDGRIIRCAPLDRGVRLTLPVA